MFLLQETLSSATGFTAGVIISLGVGLLAVLSTFAYIVLWLGRIDNRSSQNTKDVEALAEQGTKDLNALAEKVNKHVDDKAIHHDAKWLDEKFAEIKTSMEKIDRTLEGIVSQALRHLGNSNSNNNNNKT